MASTRKPKKRDMSDALRRYIRREGERFLEDPNVTSIGIGYKVKTVEKKGAKVETQTKDLSIQFTVGIKGDPGSVPEAVETKMLPTEIEVDGVKFPTDVIQRSFKPSYQIDAEARPDERKLRLDPMRPGVSIGHGDITSGL